MGAKVRYPSVSKRKVSVNSFSNAMKGTLKQKCSDLSRARMIYNFDCSDGVLKKGVGVTLYVDYITVNVSGLNALGIYEYIRFNQEINDYENIIVYYMDDKRLYWVHAEGEIVNLIADVVFESKPTVISYNYLDKDVLLISSKLSGLYYLDGTNLIKIEDAPEITSLCLHKERIFATSGGDAKSLWFSDDFNPTNWAISLDEAGFINFSDKLGKLIKVISFLDSVYVFREYGITRVVAYGDQEEFIADNLYGNYGRIFGNSVTECGDFIIMLTTAGIYSFNGLNATKILSEYDQLLYNVDNENAKGVYYNGRVYLKVNINYGVGPRSVILLYDVNKKSSYITYGLDVEDFCFFGGTVNKVLTVKGQCETGMFNFSGQFYDTPLISSWESEKCDFSLPDVLKRLYKITVYAKGNVTIAIENEAKRLTYNLVSGRVNEFYPSLSGYAFKIFIVSKEVGSEISNLCAYISYVRGN